METIIKNLIITDEPARVLKNLIHNGTIKRNKLIPCIFNHIDQTRDENKLKYMAAVVAEIRIKKTKCN